MTNKNQRIAEVIITYATKKASVRDSIQANQSVRAALGTTKSSVTSVEQAAERMNAEFARQARAQAIDKLTGSAIRAAKQTKDWRTELERVNVELARIGATDREIDDVAEQLGEAASGQRSSRRRVGGFGELGREIRLLPAVRLSGNLSTDAIGKIMYTIDSALTSIGASGRQVAAASLIAAPALILLAKGIDQFSQTVNNGRRNLTGALNAQNAYYEALQNFTSTQAREEIENLTARRALLEQQRAEVQRALDTAFAQASSAFGDAMARALDAGGQLPTAQLREQLTTLDAEYQTNIQTSSRLTQALRAQAFATNDAAAAAERWRPAVEAATRAEFERRVEMALFQAEANNLTRQQRDERRLALETERNALGSLLNTGQVTGEMWHEVRARVDELNEKIRVLNQLVKTQADYTAEAAAVQELLTRQTDNYFAALEKQVAAQQAAFEATQAYNDYLVQAAQERLALYLEYESRRTEIEAEASDRRSEIEDRGRKEREKIIRNFTRAYTTAVAERDAVAAQQAKDAAKDALKDQHDNEDESLKQADDARKKQLRSQERSYQEQQQRLEQSIARETQIRATAMQRAQVDAQNLANATAAIAQYGSNQQRVIQTTFWQDVNSIAVTWAFNTVNTLRTIMAAATSPYGYTRYGGAPGRTQPAPITYNPTINAQGLTVPQAEAVAYRSFTRALRDAGVGNGGR